jgi:hypothetical protein
MRKEEKRNLDNTVLEYMQTWVQNHLLRKRKLNGLLFRVIRVASSFF